MPNGKSANGKNGHHKKPNVLVIFGDDIGQANVSAYSHGADGLPDAQYRSNRP